MERKIDEWSKSQNISLDIRIGPEPPHPPQAQTEHVNVVFTGSGKSDDSLKIQKHPPPPIIVNNKIKKDKPIKTSKKGYHVVKTEEYPFREYIPKIPYPQRLNVDHSHLNRIVKHSLLVLRSPKYPKSKKNVLNEEEVLCQPLCIAEDVEPEPNLLLQEIIILDPNDQPMWESAKTVAPTPNSAIIQLDVNDNFVINSTYLNMIRENKFDGYLRADPHDYIREFLAICNMFGYDETQSEAVKLLIFPFSLCDKSKTWFNELNEESITSWEQMRKAFINRFFPPLLFNCLLLEIRNEPTQALLDRTARGIFLYKTLNQAFQFLEDKVLFEHDWPIKSKNEHPRKFVSFADGSNSNDDKSLFMEKLKAMDSQIISLKEEMHEMRNKYHDLKDNHASKNRMNDDTPMCERHEANYIQSEGYQN
ncbi:reverse transcriptase domain-containing protein [Tanacetum coccineum]